MRPTDQQQQQQAEQHQQHQQQQSAIGYLYKLSQSAARSGPALVSTRKSFAAMLNPANQSQANQHQLETQANQQVPMLDKTNMQAANLSFAAGPAPPSQQHQQQHQFLHQQQLQDFRLAGRRGAELELMLLSAENCNEPAAASCATAGPAANLCDPPHRSLDGHLRHHFQHHQQHPQQHPQQQQQQQQVHEHLFSVIVNSKPISGE